MNKFEKARETVRKKIATDGVTITLTRSNKSRNEVTGEISEGTPTTHQATGFFKPINSLSTDKNVALRGDFKSTDSVFSTPDDIEARDKFTHSGKDWDVVAVLPISPTGIVILNKAVVREL